MPRFALPLFQFEKIYPIFHDLHKKNTAAADIVLISCVGIVHYLYISDEL